MQAIRVVTTLAAVAGSVAALFAVISYQVLCQDGTHGSCLEARGASDQLVAQLLVAIAGLVAVGCSVYLAGKHRRQAAVLALVLGLVLYAAWAVLLDLATHGGRFTLL